MILEKIQIESILPHREPFLFVDGVMEFSHNKIRAFLNLSEDLPFFKGHFPGNPIMPGVLVTESLAQTSGLCLTMAARSDKSGTLEFSDGDVFYLASANIKYLAVARAGEKLELFSSMTRGFNGLYHFCVSASSGRNRIAEGSLVLASPKNVER